MTSKELPWWITIKGSDLCQGDLLVNCLVPIFPANADIKKGGTIEVSLEQRSVVVLTQSCDLQQRKSPFVAVCAVHSLEEIEEVNPQYRSKGAWEPVRQGRQPGYHLLASVEDLKNNRKALVVDFRQIYSLPLEYLEAHAGEMSNRPRLVSPYLEHFAQSFARFFMRVGLPSNIPPYK